MDRPKPTAVSRKQARTVAPAASAGQSLRQQAELRAKAEAELTSAQLAGMTPAAIQRMVHELHVHQIELELQNEELRLTQETLEVSRASYSALYELAPIGYITINSAGIILQANLTLTTMLGVTRSALVKKPLSRFIFKADQDIYYLHRKQLLASGEPQTCELRLLKHDGTAVWIRLEATLGQDADDQPVCRAVISDITARKQSEQSLLIKSLAFDISLAASSIADPQGRLTEANPAFLRIWGYSNKDDVIGQPISSFLKDPHEAEAIIAALRTSGQWEGYYTAKKANGESFIAHGLATAVRNQQGELLGFQSTTLDVTQDRQAAHILDDWAQTLEKQVRARTRELHHSQDRFRQLTNATFEGIAITEGGKVVDGNPQLATIHGYELAEMIGRPVTDFIAPESRAAVARRIREEQVKAYEFLGLRKDGSTFPVESRANLQTWQGKKSRLVALRDLTEQKQLAATIHAQQAELERVHRLAMVSEISSGIIHQIGQPLCSMGANLQVAMSKLNDCNMKRCGCLEIVTDIDSDVVRIREVINHLRSLSHPEQPSRELIDFNALVAKTIDMLRKDARIRKILLTMVLGDDLPPVPVDAVQLSQVIINLVRNALDACADCPADRRKVNITTRMVVGKGVELSVCDAGTGITPDACKQLFSPFFTTKTHGLGIGLRLSKTIIKAHGGTLKGSNNTSRIGATFKFVLPCDDSPR